MVDEIEDGIQQQIDSFELSIGSGVGSSYEQASQVNKMIFSAVAITAKEFGNIKVRVDEKSSIIIVKIILRWRGKLSLRWLRLNKFFDWQRDKWRSEAIANCKEFVPDGYRLMLFYERDRYGRFL